MAERPVFLSYSHDIHFVKEVSVGFPWHPGFAVVQKQKNIHALHDAAAKRGLSPLLEVSTKSEVKLGQRLSAFNLPVQLADGTKVPLECVFQGSKVFERGGPFSDLLRKDS